MMNMISLWPGMDNLIWGVGAWLGLTASLFNMLIPLWLGVLIFFTAERRAGGASLILAGMLMGSLFFASHSMLLTHHLMGEGSAPAADFWWRVGWLPILLIPLLWYLVMLWYAGFWEEAGGTLFQRHRLPLFLVSSATALLFGLLLFADTLPPYAQVTETYLAGGLPLEAVPLLWLLYPPHLLLTMLLPMDALRHPQPSQRMMGDLARARAHIWLIWVCRFMVLVSVMVLAFVYGLAFDGLPAVGAGVIRFVEVFDLGVTLLIVAMLLMIGQAVIRYEIFTGKTLPRRGFERLWRHALLICAGTAGFISFSLLFALPPAYSLFTLGLMLVVAFGVLSWRTFVHRDHLIKRLRPFTHRQGSAQYLFDLICRDMLQTEKACLVPLAPPLAKTPLYFQTHQPPPDVDRKSLLDKPIAPLAEHTGYCWVMPVWSTRGLVGLLFMGHKEDDSLYTEEEIEAAGASLERVLDLLIREELGARVLEVERTRQTQQRLFDRQTQRVLHDEVLPELHLAILNMDDSAAREALIQVHRQLSDLIYTTNTRPGRLNPSHGLIGMLRDIVQDEFSQAFDSVTWQGDPDFTLSDALMQEVVIHAAREAIRNAAKHGRGADHQRKLHLTICAESSTLLSITDDGVGQLHPWDKDNGGLALHSTMLAIMGGELQVAYPVAGGTRIVIRLRS